jgi:hypothetical protein
MAETPNVAAAIETSHGAVGGTIQGLEDVKVIGMEAFRGKATEGAQINGRSEAA